MSKLETAHSKERARDELWRRGILAPWKLHADQLTTYNFMMGSKAARFVLEIARQWGKTWLLTVIASEICIRNPGTRIVYGAPTVKHLEEFILPTLEDVTGDAPAGCRSKYSSSRGHWDFENGSHIHLFGADDKTAADRGRGPKAAACMFDEAGFCKVLDYVLRSVFRPQLLHSGGRTFISSTPALDPDHPFTHIAELAEARGNYVRRTIHDNPLLSKERVAEVMAEDAADCGMTVEEYAESPEFRREYLAHRVIDDNSLVLPEWDRKRAALVKAVERPKLFRGQVSFDVGGADPHAMLFGYWHFELAKWVIEDELFLRNNENTEVLAQAIKEKERSLWGVDCWDGTVGSMYKPQPELLENVPQWMLHRMNMPEPQRQPYSRWGDNNNLTLLRDMYDLHGVAIYPTRKDDLEAQVNNLRVLIGRDKVLMHPRCKNADRHWRGTMWENSKRMVFARRAGEHGDLVSAGIYGSRNLDTGKPEDDLEPYMTGDFSTFEEMWED